jgi:hypothetical protein
MLHSTTTYSHTDKSEIKQSKLENVNYLIETDADLTTKKRSTKKYK